MKWLENEWKQCKAFFLENVIKASIKVGAAFFGIGIFVWIFLYMNEEVMIACYNALMSIFEESGMDLDNIGALALFTNNARACFLAMLMGFIPFFYVDVFSLFINGASIGIVGSVYMYEKMSMLVLAAGLIPHGIFEFPAIFISLAIGFKTCHLLTQYITGKTNAFHSKEYMMNVLRVYVFIVLPLLVVAAIVEAYITPICMALFM